MPFVTVLALVTGAVVGRLRGGRLRHIGQHRIRAWALVIVGFGLQVATDHWNVDRLGTALVITGSLALLLFAALNRHLVGMGIVALGVAANALVIGLNDGMPVSPSAVVAAHVASASEEPSIGYGYRHHREGSQDKVAILSDIIPIPELHEVVSFGDLILALGVAATVAHLLDPRNRHGPKR